MKNLLVVLTILFSLTIFANDCKNQYKVNEKMCGLVFEQCMKDCGVNGPEDMSKEKEVCTEPCVIEVIMCLMSAQELYNRCEINKLNK